MEFIDHFIFIGWSLLLLSLFYVVGSLILSTYTSKSNIPFYALLAGMVFCTTTFSLFVSSFKSISIGIFLIIVLYLIKHNGWRFSKPKITFEKKILLVFPAFVLLYIISYFVKYYSSGGNIQNDTLFQIHLSNYLYSTGKESLCWDYFSPKTVRLNAYHYFAAWYIALIRFFTAVSPFKSVYLISIPILQLISVTGIWELLKSFEMKNKLIYSFSLLFPFFNSFNDITFIKNVDFFKYSEVINFNSYDEPMALKTNIAYLIFIPIIIFIKKNNLNLVLYTVLALPFISMLYAPLSILLAFFIVLYKKIKFGNVDWYGLFSLVSIVIFINLFYWYFGSNQFVNKSLILDTLNFHNIIIRVVVVIERLTYLLILFSPFVLIACINLFTNNWLKSNAKILLFMTTILILSIIIWLLLFESFGSNEYFNVPVITNLNILLFSFLSVVLFSNTYKLKFRIILFITTIALFVPILFSSIRKSKRIEDLYSKEFLSELSSVINKKEIRVAVLVDNETLEGPFLNPFVEQNGDYLLHFCYSYSLLSLNHTKKLYSNCSDPIWKNYIKNSLIYKFEEKKFYPNEDALRISFLKNYKIKLIVTSKDVSLSNNLKKLVKRVISDSKSGEQLIVLI